MVSYFNKLHPLQIKDLALAAIAITLHNLVGGSGLLTVLRNAADAACKMLIDFGFIPKSSSIEEAIAKLSEALMSRDMLNGADYVKAELKSDHIVIEIRNCSFKSLCSCVEKFADKHVQVLQVRPCAIALLYTSVVEQLAKTRFELVELQCSEGNAVIKMRKFASETEIAVTIR